MNTTVWIVTTEAPDTSPHIEVFATARQADNYIKETAWALADYSDEHVILNTITDALRYLTGPCNVIVRSAEYSVAQP